MLHAAEEGGKKASVEEKTGRHTGRGRRGMTRMGRVAGVAEALENVFPEARTRNHFNRRDDKVLVPISDGAH